MCFIGVLFIKSRLMASDIMFIRNILSPSSSSLVARDLTDSLIDSFFFVYLPPILIFKWCY